MSLEDTSAERAESPMIGDDSERKALKRKDRSSSDKKKSTKKSSEKGSKAEELVASPEAIPEKKKSKKSPKKTDGKITESKPAEAAEEKSDESSKVESKTPEVLVIADDSQTDEKSELEKKAERKAARKAAKRALKASQQETATDPPEESPVIKISKSQKRKIRESKKRPRGSTDEREASESAVLKTLNTVSKNANADSDSDSENDANDPSGDTPLAKKQKIRAEKKALKKTALTRLRGDSEMILDSSDMTTVTKPSAKEKRRRNAANYKRQRQKWF
ncbi:hypothetical protein DFS34DRAFT_645380 [Phlyctochytrium arcticum]|nr:hypothetical protein DFS34DRAFT_645380 [Phlyctochytrium arcticum]